MSELLRRCQVLAARLGIAELDEWVRHELNGYPPDVALPDYRVFAGVAKGHFSGPFGRAIRNAVLPAQNLPKEYRHWAREASIRQPIAALQEFATSKNDITSEWPGDLVARVQRNFYEHMALGQAWLVLSRSDFVSAIETVRNRILSFALDAEKLVNSDESSAAESITSGLSQVFYTNVFGNVGNLAQGSETVHQQSGVLPGDFSSLLAELQKMSVPSADVDALQVAIDKDGAAKMGTNVSDWMGKMFGKAASGIWSIGLTTATTVLPKLLLKYYGIDSK